MTRPRLGAIAAVLTLLALTACSGDKRPTQAATSSSIRVVGSVSINAAFGAVSAGTEILDPTAAPVHTGPCKTTEGYSDIASGASVVISDDKANTLAITDLGAGNFDANGVCVFDFTASVPAGKGFYGISVTHRGTVKFSEADVRHPALTLGG